MASFYNLLAAWDLSSVTIIPINCLSRYHKPIKAEQLYKTYDYLDSSGKVFDYTKNIFANDNKKELKEKLKGAFGYANISRASLFQEEKYMNLWVALESLARTNMYPDIISNVKRTVPAAVSMRYIYRIVRNYVEDCSRCDVKFDFQNFVINMKQESKQNLVKETIQVFHNPELYRILLHKCEVNSLLKYRTESVHKILNETEFACKKVKNNNNRVEWQIQRLYRIRNEIAHAALQNETSLIVYIEHLYDYLSIYISEIVTSVAIEDKMGIEEALSLIRDNYEVFDAFAKNKEYLIIEDEVLKTGVINLIH